MQHRERTGVWLVGGRGSVATTVIAGTAAIVSGLSGVTGCVSELPPFRDLGLAPFGSLVFGGHDIGHTSLHKRAEQLVAGGVLPHGLPDHVAYALSAADAEIRPGIPAGPGGGPQAADAATLTSDLLSFRQRHELDRVVVVNLASTEPAPPADPAFESPRALREALAQRAGVLPPSALYAYAALQARCPYIDFTPSAGMRIPALTALAGELGVPYAGRDGKTGETLVKSALAPMFAQRALRVRAWSGTNLLGGGDGATLEDPGAADSKTRSKERSLTAVLGDGVEGRTHIDHVSALGEWKTAWDHIVFEGFLGVRMTLQFTWQGCDSALAAPLVLDLARLMAHADRRGATGEQRPLGFFFKDPGTGGAHALAAQFEELARWAA